MYEPTERDGEWAKEVSFIYSLRFHLQSNASEFATHFVICFSSLIILSLERNSLATRR